MNSLPFFARLSALTLPFLMMGASCGPISGGCPEIDLGCPDGQELVDTNGDGCADSCEAIVICLAFPVCAEGETEVDDAGGCLLDDAVCYENTVCGSTIWCTGPDVAVDTCFADTDCGDEQFCDTENFCESACRPESGADCVAVCMGRCVDLVICPSIGIQCAEGEISVDTNNDGCFDACEPDFVEG